MKKQESTLNIRYVEKDKYLLASIFGEIATARIAIVYWKKIVSECSKRLYRNLILEGYFMNKLGTVGIYEASKEIAFLSRRYNINIALVDRNEENYEKNSFGETVVKNWGGNGQVFNCIDEAEEWLMEDIEA